MKPVYGWFSVQLQYWWLGKASIRRQYSMLASAPAALRLIVSTSSAQPKKKMRDAERSTGIPQTYTNSPSKICRYNTAILSTFPKKPRHKLHAGSKHNKAPLLPCFKLAAKLDAKDTLPQLTWLGGLHAELCLTHHHTTSKLLELHILAGCI